MTDLIKRAKAALETYETQLGFAGPYGITDLEWMAPDLARALIREREAAEALVDLIEGDLVGTDWKRECYARVAAYREATKETNNDK